MNNNIAHHVVTIISIIFIQVVVVVFLAATSIFHLTFLASIVLNMTMIVKEEEEDIPTLKNSEFVCHDLLQISKPYQHKIIISVLQHEKRVVFYRVLQL